MGLRNDLNPHRSASSVSRPWIDAPISAKTTPIRKHPSPASPVLNNTVRSAIKESKHMAKASLMRHMPPSGFMQEFDQVFEYCLSMGA